MSRAPAPEPEPEPEPEPAPEPEPEPDPMRDVCLGFGLCWNSGISNTHTHTDTHILQAR